MMRIMVNEMPTLVFAGVASLGAIDAAQKFKIPLVLNSPTFPFGLDVLPILGCQAGALDFYSCHYGTDADTLFRLCPLLTQHTLEQVAVWQIYAKVPITT